MCLHSKYDPNIVECLVNVFGTRYTLGKFFTSIYCVRTFYGWGLTTVQNIRTADHHQAAKQTKKMRIGHGESSIKANKFNGIWSKFILSPFLITSKRTNEPSIELVGWMKSFLLKSVFFLLRFLYRTHFVFKWRWWSYSSTIYLLL